MGNGNGESGLDKRTLSLSHGEYTYLTIGYRTGHSQVALYLIEPLISCRLASTPASSARFASATSAAWIARRLSTSFSHAVHTTMNQLDSTSAGWQSWRKNLLGLSLLEYSFSLPTKASKSSCFSWRFSRDLLWSSGLYRCRTLD